MSRTGPAEDRAVLALAESQHGVVTRSQLDELGVGRRALARRLEAGWLHRIHQGVYAVGRPQLAPNGHRLAAVLACGPRAVLSHKSAGQVWDLLRTAQMRIDVTVPGTSRRGRAGIRIHRTRALQPEDTETFDGIPLTSVPRTVVDLAADLNRDQTLRVVEQGARLECLDFGALRRTLDRNPNHKGNKTLRLTWPTSPRLPSRARTSSVTSSRS